jgi:hypothetical protein
VKTEIKPINYTLILDLSDRVLASQQLEKDFYLIEKTFNEFEKNARRGLIINSKARFSVKIIPQKNSPLNTNYYEDILQLHLDEIQVKDKNTSLLKLSKALPAILNKLKKEALFANNSKGYFGVDIWAYLHNNGMQLSKKNHQNTIIIITDGYFDFENETHVLKDNNKYTSTRFLKQLETKDWKQLSKTKEYGLLPIKLEKQTNWIIAGISGKNGSDILQTEKISYFWTKWLLHSGASSPSIILNASKTEMGSYLIQKIKKL